MRDFTGGGCVIRRVSIFVLFLLVSAVNIQAELVTTQWGGDASSVYDTGFMHMLMKGENACVSLFNMELLENDSPGFREDSGSGFHDDIWGKNRARKLFFLDNPAAFSAWLVLGSRYKSGTYPLKASINGNEIVLSLVSEKNVEWFRWEEFPAEWLKKGKNEIDFYCPEAADADEGWKIMLSRADRFEEGGADPTSVGDCSYKSFDGGRSWKESPFGNDGMLRAEYAVMLSLDRHVKTGWLESEVIDIWKGDSNAPVVPLREIRSLELKASANVPDACAVEYFFRKGIDPSPFSESWEEYRKIGEGDVLDFSTVGADLNRRYVQVKVVLSTGDPLKSPELHNIQLTAQLEERIPLHENIHIIESDNNPVKYSSIDWKWESFDRPEYLELRERENLDEVIAGSRTQFEAQVKLLDHVGKRWRHGSPWPGYPAPDALSILDKVESSGVAGYCNHFNHLLLGCCKAYGWQARMVYGVGHAIMEVWNDDYGKWILMDADNVNQYNYDSVIAEPLNLYELHNRYLDYYFPGKTLDWMSSEYEGLPAGSKWFPNPSEENAPVKRGSLVRDDSAKLTAFVCAGFVRILTRNNWFAEPHPVPLIHGSSTGSPWNCYIHWYDRRTPPKRNFSWYTDRPRDMWPDLNTVHIDAVSGFGNDRLFLRFETYTPCLDHFEVDVDDTGWQSVGDRWTWLLGSGRNTLKVRSVNTRGVKGKSSYISLNHADRPFAE